MEKRIMMGIGVLTMSAFTMIIPTGVSHHEIENITYVDKKEGGEKIKKSETTPDSKDGDLRKKDAKEEKAFIYSQSRINY